MLVLKINDVKNFMNQLLIGQTFDDFSLVEASLQHFAVSRSMVSSTEIFLTVTVNSSPIRTLPTVHGKN